MVLTEFLAVLDSQKVDLPPHRQDTMAVFFQLNTARHHLMVFKGIKVQQNADGSSQMIIILEEK